MRFPILCAAFVACLCLVAPAMALEPVRFDAFDAELTPIDLFDDGSTSLTDASSVPIVHTSTVPPVPAVESDQAAVPNLNEAFRRLKAAGYVWKEVDACELCDTCPAGFRYTGETFFVAEKVDQVATATPVASCPCLAADGTCPCMTTTAPVVRSVEASCGTETFASPVYAYEANCGSEGYATGYGMTRQVAAPRGIFRGGLFSRWRSRLAEPAAYSSSYWAPAYLDAPMPSFGACASGNCGF